MPSTYAHFRFGTEMAGRFTEKTKQCIRRHEALYLIGLHGPDILFYYHPYKTNPVHSLGEALHDRPASEFFEHAQKRMASMPEALRDAGEAYLAGFLCHFTLDENCHGYIERKIHASHVSHAEIEMEFDRYLMTEDGYDPLHHYTAGHISTDKSYAAFVSRFFEAVTPSQVRSALRIMKLSHSFLPSPGVWERKIIDGILRLSGNYEEVHGFLISRQPSKRCSDSNLRLMKLMKKAGEDALLLDENLKKYLRNQTKLDVMFQKSFGPEKGWEQIPVLHVSEEREYRLSN